MANPQLEDGRTEIANEIVEALAKINLSAYESRVLWCVLRKTYGWHKKIDRISYTQFEETTGMKRWHIARTIKLLLARQMITCQGSGQTLEYAFQKDYAKWLEIHRNHTKPLPNGVILIPDSTVTQRGNSEPSGNRYLTGCEPLPNGVSPLPNGVTKPLPNGVNTKAIKHITKAYTKAYGEFKNVLLSDEEYAKLVGVFGEPVTRQKIEDLSQGIASKGYKYKSHYATIQSWDRMEKKRRGLAGTHDRRLPTDLAAANAAYLERKRGLANG